MTALTQISQDPLTYDSVLDTLTGHSEPENNLPSDPLTSDSVLDTLTAHSAPRDNSDSLTHDSVLDTLTDHSEQVVAGLDWERGGWHISIDGKPARFVSRDDLLNDPISEADVVVVEQAHMRERNLYSVAQVYTREELERLPFRNKLRLFPGMPGQLARAARAVGNITDKVNKYGQALPDKDKDAETMAAYAKANPQKLSSWKKFRLPGEDPSRRLWEARDELRNDLREILNPLRAAWNVMSIPDKYALPEVAQFCEFLDRIFDGLSPEIKEQFGIRRSRNGIRVERMTAALTAYMSVYTREGKLRVRPDGEFIGIRFILDSIGLSNSYRPNMARSQLTHYGMRNYKGGRDGGYRSEYMRNLRRFLAIMRDADSLTPDSVPDTLTTHSEQQGELVTSGDSLTADSVLDTLTPHSEPASSLA